MIRPQQEQLRQQAIAEAMSELVSDSRFQTFMEVIKEQREVAVDDLKQDEVLANERKLLAAIGEIRTYDSILAAYRDFLSRKAI